MRLDLGQHLLFFEYLACSADDAEERVLGDVDGEASFLAEAAIEAAQLRAAAGQGNPVCHEIANELRRGYFDR